MTTSSDVERLLEVELLQPLNADSRAKLASAGTFQTFPNGSLILSQGEPHHTLGIILSGRVKVSCHAHGDFVEVVELGPGESLGEMAIIDPKKASADVRVLQEARLWLLSAEEFERFVAQDLAEGYRFLHLLARRLCHRLRATDERLLRVYDELRANLVRRI